MHYDRRVSAQFKDGALEAGVTQNLPGDLPAPCKAHERDRRVGYERAAHFWSAMHDIEHARRQSGFDRDLSQQHRGARTLRMRLEHQRIPSRERRPELVGNKVERRVERRDAGDNAYRLIDCETQFSTPGRNWVHWNYHAVDAFGFLRGHLHG